MNFKVSKEYKRDLNKLSPEILSSPEFSEVMYHLHQGLTLPAKYKDHSLTGNLSSFRDCYIKNDLVLIYQINDDGLYLYRLNTHSEIFG